MMQPDQRRPQPAAQPRPSRPGAERSAPTRKIDCAPGPGASGPQNPSTGRGRGIPDPERWGGDSRTAFRT